MKIISGGVCAAKGFKASGVHCGIRKNRTKKDLALIYSETIATAAATYTTNLVKGAPLTRLVVYTAAQDATVSLTIKDRSFFVRL